MNTTPSPHDMNETKPAFRSVNTRQQIPTLIKPSMISGKSSPEYLVGRSNVMSKRRQSRGRWIVAAAKPIPFFGLDTGSVEINFNAAIVAARIDDCLRLRSVEVDFDSDNAEAICKTSRFLEYKICLFESNDGASTFVEMMRIHGCGYEFRAEREAVMNAAKGLGVVTLAPPKPLPIPAELMQKYVPPSDSELESTIHRACDALHSSNCHCVLFALQNLAAVTNTNNSHSATAHKTSMLIMENESNIRDVILAIYLAKAQNATDDVSDQIGQACLTIMEHGLQSLAANNSGYLDQTYTEFAEKLIPRLIQDIKQCDCSRTSNSCLALQCLNLILKHSSRACQTAQEIGLRDTIAHAEEYGRREYLKLEHLARSTIEVLQCS